MPNEMNLNPYEDDRPETPVNRMGNEWISVIGQEDGSLSVSLPGIGKVAAIRFDLSDPLPPDGIKRNRARLLGFAPFLHITDSADAKAAVFERTITGKGGGISFVILPEPGTEVILFPRESLSSSLFAIRHGGKTVLYTHVKGNCGISRKDLRLYFPFPRVKLRLFAAPLNAVGRMISLPVTPPDRNGFLFPPSALPDGLRERAASVLEREAGTLDALKTAGGLFRTSEGRLSLRDQQYVFLFFLAAGERGKAEAILDTVLRSYRTNHFLSPFFDPETGIGAPEKRYPETDAALAVTEMFLSLASGGDAKQLSDRYGDLLSYAVTVLRDGIRNYRLPYAGHEPELDGLPFLTRFHASARATAAFIRNLRALSALFPDDKKITGTAALAEEAEKHFAEFFLGEHGYFEDSVLPSARSLPPYLYGTCQFCGLRGRIPTEGWLIKKDGWYRCEVCYGDGFAPVLPKQQEHPSPRFGKSLPAYLSVLGFTDETTEKGEKALLKRTDALDLTEAALLLLAEKRFSVPLVIRILNGIEEKEKIAELSEAGIGQRAFAAAALLLTANPQNNI